MNENDLFCVLSHLTRSMLTCNEPQHLKSLKAVFDVLYPIWEHMNENDIDCCTLSVSYDEKGNKI